MNAPGTTARRNSMLRTALGPVIVGALSDPLVTEVMVNPDGLVRLDRAGEGRSETGARLDPAHVERIIRLVASRARTEVHQDAPIVSAELQGDLQVGAGERFEGILPPVSTGPCFSIRKPASRIYRLDDYVRDLVMDLDVAVQLKEAISQRQNILVTGGTSTGKTTLANALLAEIASRDERVITIEDTRELQCSAPDVVALRTQPGAVTMSDLVRSTLRLRPDRIVIGEVRGGEALAMLKAWNTGHPGGIATVHANGPRQALTRLEQLVQEAVPSIPRQLIADAIDVVVFLEGRGRERHVVPPVFVHGLDANGEYSLSSRASNLAPTWRFK